MRQGKQRRPGDSLHWWGDSAGRFPLLTAAEEIELGRMVRAWQDHPDGPDGAPAGVRRRGMRARDRMVTANLRLVMKCAGRRQRTEAGEDYLQAGAEGLVKAALRFDPERGYKFSTFAYWWIWQAQNVWKEHMGMVYVSACTLHNIRKGNHEPGSEIAMAAAVALQGCVSLEARPDDEDGRGATFAELIPAPGSDPLELAAAVEALEAFQAAGGDDAAMLELRAEGALLRDMAELEGLSLGGLRERMAEARQRLQLVPAVADLLAA